MPAQQPQTNTHADLSLEREVLGLILNAADTQGSECLPALERDLLPAPAALMANAAHQAVYTQIRLMLENGQAPTPYEVRRATQNGVSAQDWAAIINADQAAQLAPHIQTLQRLAGARVVQAAAAHAISALAGGAEPVSVQEQLQDALAAGDANTTRPRAAAELGSVAAYLEALTNGGIPMVGTGFPELDKRLGGGIEPGTYALIGMPTNVGKTRLALGIAYAQLVAGRGVTYVSGEMKSTAGGANATHRLKLALVLMKAGIPPRLINRHTKIGADTMQRIQDAEAWLNASPFHVHDRDMSTDTIAAIARRMRREGQTLMVVDNLNHVTLPGGERLSGWEQKNIISERLADIAHSTGIIVITLVQTQINSQLERPARLDELSDSKGIARPADLVLTAWRPIQDAIDKMQADDPVTMGKIHIAKRRSGVGGDVDIMWREDLAMWLPSGSRE